MGEELVDVFFDDLKVTHVKSPIVQQDDYYPFGLTFNSYSRENSVLNMYQYNGKEIQDELDLGWLDYGARMYQPEIARWNAIDPLSFKYYGSSPYNYVLGNPVTNVDVKGQWTVPIHYSMSWASLVVEHGVEVKQAQLLAHYTSVYADHPKKNILFWGNVGHNAPGLGSGYISSWQSYKSNIHYSGTENSQVTNWNSESGGFNNNIRHSMSALFELQNGMTTEEAMLRGMEFGWSQVFASAQSENSINSLKANSREIEMFGTGIHALQDAYAHHGSHMDESVGGIVSHIHNDMTNKPDMAKAQKITTSAITVYKLMTNDFSSLSKKQVFNIATTGMNSTQLMGLFQQIHRYLAYEKPKKEK